MLEIARGAQIERPLHARASSGRGRAAAVYARLTCSCRGGSVRDAARDAMRARTAIAHADRMTRVEIVAGDGRERRACPRARPRATRPSRSRRFGLAARRRHFALSLNLIVGSAGVAPPDLRALCRRRRPSCDDQRRRRCSTAIATRMRRWSSTMRRPAARAASCSRRSIDGDATGVFQGKIIVRPHRAEDRRQDDVGGAAALGGRRR